MAPVDEATQRRRIRQLRAKAASTPFEPEAEACRAKAYELEAALRPERVDLFGQQTVSVTLRDGTEEWVKVADLEEQLLIQAASRDPFAAAAARTMLQQIADDRAAFERRREPTAETVWDQRVAQGWNPWGAIYNHRGGATGATTTAWNNVHITVNFGG